MCFKFINYIFINVTRFVFVGLTIKEFEAFTHTKKGKKTQHMVALVKVRYTHERKIIFILALEIFWRRVIFIILPAVYNGHHSGVLQLHDWTNISAAVIPHRLMTVHFHTFSLINAWIRNCSTGETMFHCRTPVFLGSYITEKEGHDRSKLSFIFPFLSFRDQNIFLHVDYVIT